MRNDLTEGSITKGLLSFFSPIWLGSFIQYFYITVDAIIVGNYVGKTGLAAVGGSTGVITDLLIGLFVGLSSGAGIVVSRYVGARDEAMINKSIRTTAALAIAVSVIFTLAGLLFAPWILHAINTPADVFPYALTFLSIYFSGISAAIVFNFGSAILRAVGDARRPTRILILCCICNIALDYLFIGVMGMGVAGAGYATITSQAISAICVIYCLMNTKDSYRLNVKKISFDVPLLKNMVKIGLTTGLQMMMYSVSNLIIQTNINGFGTDIVAAYSAYGKIEMFILVMVEAFSVAVTTFTGQNIGAQKYNRMRLGVRSGMVMCLALTVSFSILLLLFDQQILRLFTADAGVIAQSSGILHCIAPFYFTYIIISIIPSALRSAGDIVMPIIFTFIGICVFRIIIIYTGLQLCHDIRIISYSYPVSWAVTSTVFLIYYKKGKWLRRFIFKNLSSAEHHKLYG